MSLASLSVDDKVIGGEFEACCIFFGFVFFFLFSLESREKSVRERERDRKYKTLFPLFSPPSRSLPGAVMLPAAAAPPEPVANPEATAATLSVVDESGLAPLVERRRDEHEEDDDDGASTFSASSSSSVSRHHPASLCASAALVSLIHLLGAAACLVSLLLGATKHWARLPGSR